VHSWRRIAERVRPWEGDWLGVHTAGLGRSNRRALHRRQRALRFLGFRALEPGLEVRPDNLRTEGPPAAATRARLRALGLESDALVFELRGLDAGTDARARALWDPADLRRAYRAQIARLHSSAAKLPTLPRDQAMVESFLLGGAAIRELAYDPLLPDEIVPTQERDMLVATLLHYDELGRGCWAGALELDDHTAPADVRGFDAVGALATAEGI
jgi:phenylacetic acid degradation operon negative regulatory protein